MSEQNIIEIHLLAEMFQCGKMCWSDRRTLFEAKALFYSTKIKWASALSQLNSFRGTKLMLKSFSSLL